jgi:hypothetical protein
MIETYRDLLSRKGEITEPTKMLTSFQKAMFGFFANLVSLENVRKSLLKDTSIFVECLEES